MHWTGPVKADHVAFELPLKNYNDLRHANFLVPRILVVVVVPESVDDWVEQSEDSLVLHYCGYWLSLRGDKETSNKYKKTVHLPRDQIFSVRSLREMMNRIAEADSL